MLTRRRAIVAAVVVLVSLLPLFANAYQVDVLTQAASYSFLATYSLASRAHTIGSLGFVAARPSRMTLAYSSFPFSS